MIIPDVYWIGGSQQTYGYWSHPLPYSYGVKQHGNYIFAKIAGLSWVPIFIGQGDLKERTNDQDLYNCAVRKGATHLHLHFTSNEKERIAEEADLLLRHPQAYAPTGCNRKPGG